MVVRDKQRSTRRWWVRTALAVGGVGAAVAAFSFARQPGPSSPPAQTAPAPQVATPVALPSDSDYVTRPVAFIGRDTVITREELGEFLIYRRGILKIDPLVNRRIIDIACREAGVEVTAGEVEASFAEDLKGFGGITPGEFVKQVLHRYGKNLTEWKEDVIRPKLMLAKLCRNRVHVSEEDVTAAFEARYGEKVECRIIQWPGTEAAQAKIAYPKIRDSEQAFSDAAKNQTMSALASAGGKIRPLNHHLAEFNPPFGDKGVNDRIEKEAFRLQPGEVSGILEIPDGFIVIKCDKRIPADTTINPAAVRADLVKEMTEKRTLTEIPKLFNELHDKAKPISAMEGQPAMPPAYTPGVSKGRVVAYIYGNVPITREELGEFLITRYGAETLELLVNRRIIADECKAKGVVIDDLEVTAVEQGKIAAAGGPDAFKKILIANHTLPFQFREDVLRPQLELARLCAERVKVTDEDLKAAFEAYHGEKVECRFIMWPKEERKFAMAEYADLRDDEKKFCKKAAHQANPELAKNEGHLMDGAKVRLIGRHTLGNTELERELFSLRPGEVSKLVETREGIVVMKCDNRLPPDGTVSLDSVREQLAKEVKERKIQIETPYVFAELRKKADPRLLLKDPNRAVDLTAEVSRDLKGGPQLPKHAGKDHAATQPAGN